MEPLIPRPDASSPLPGSRCAWPPPEENPWRNLSYIVTTLQLMATLLDLFLESGDIRALHYTITTLQFLPALYLTIYQSVRIAWLRRHEVDTEAEGASNHKIIKPAMFLVLALSLQLYVVVVSGMWYNIALDVNSYNLEWSVFAVVLLWSLVNPATYSSVADFVASNESSNTGAPKKVRMGPGAAAVSVFTKHFMQEKVLFFLGALAACGGAILSTYQGAIINELTKLVTRKTLDPTTGELKIAATYEEVELQAATLVIVWAAANLARFIFDVLSALMFSRLEVWLRGEVFERAMASVNASPGEDGDANISDPAAEFGARYASDVQGVVSLYATLLRGVIVNIILIVTNFAFLAIVNWEVAVATLCFLAMAVTSGPTDLAGNAAVAAQKKATEGLGMLSEGVRSIEASGESSDICRTHSEEILEPMRSALFNQLFYTNSVDTYINFFSSFLTVIVVITMSVSVYEGEMDSSDFLGVFFVFKQLQKPAMKMSGVLKSLIKKSASLERLNDTIFG